MLYFHKVGLVFLATPKTGSTAIEHAMSAKADMVFQGDPNIKHCTFQRYQWRVEKAILMFVGTPPETVALIRDPQDWLSSWFRFRHGAWLNGTPRSTRGMSFDAFVEGYLSDPQPAFAAVGRQARFLTQPKTGQTVDRLFRYDAMPAFATWLGARLKTPITLEQHNVSPDWQVSLSGELQHRLQDRFAEDYALYRGALSDPPG